MYVNDLDNLSLQKILVLCHGGAIYRGMIYLADLPGAWQQISGYPVAKGRIRLVRACADRWISGPGRRRKSPSVLDRVRWLQTCYASDNHDNAVAAAKAIAALSIPTHEAGPDKFWPTFGQPFEETLAKIIENARKGRTDAGTLVGVQICTSEPEAALYIAGRNLKVEVYRYFNDRPVPPFSRPQSFNNIPGRDVIALALLGQSNPQFSIKTEKSDGSDTTPAGAPDR
jgi:hypothetical protein